MNLARSTALGLWLGTLAAISPDHIGRELPGGDYVITSTPSTAVTLNLPADGNAHRVKNAGKSVLVVLSGDCVPPGMTIGSDSTSFTIVAPGVTVECMSQSIETK